ncbi:hypothetical protein MKX07_000546 [Trichoderma sp. CBMAI-0711]|nr:hypothetical protein MKX07_000546 [Trichoderma sp. CBMAI-0711]
MFRSRCVQPIYTIYPNRPPRPLTRLSDGTFVPRPPTPPSRGLSEAELARWYRFRQVEDMQDYLWTLWTDGRHRLGRLADAHVLVRALPLTGARSPTASPSEAPDVPASSLSSPTSMTPKRLSLRAIVRPQSGQPFGLKREFDLDALRETVSEPPHSISPARFDLRECLSWVRPPNGSRRASWPAAAASASSIEEDDVADERRAVKIVKPSAPVQAHGLLPMSVGVPIHLDYARATLPALAAIIMSDRVNRGDTIDLALPHPEAWPETVAYVYLGRVEFLNAETEKNVIYLGGKVGRGRYARDGLRFFSSQSTFF